MDIRWAKIRYKFHSDTEHIIIYKPLSRLADCIYSPWLQIISSVWLLFVSQSNVYDDVASTWSNGFWQLRVDTISVSKLFYAIYIENDNNLTKTLRCTRYAQIFISIFTFTQFANTHSSLFLSTIFSYQYVFLTPSIARCTREETSRRVVVVVDGTTW